ncbi:SRPBCC family protein [Pseudoroseicyclus aestuarii]|uniref:Putative membrane protein n=1 Tax=Pseudoroseicyclus aestuarii TaxID=1795041 RepID=A0A318SNY4_9RHOB|nr:SRPBCC family protein [Pseudoroseicyclus aestuarii]PYE82544.1 putative membrane protein [Pseudoroseicyclus aestuarii]
MSRTITYPRSRTGASGALGLVALAAAGLYLGYKGSRRSEPAPAVYIDDAPRRTARGARDSRRARGQAVVGRSVTINKTPREVYDFWRDFGNLARFMENIEAVSTVGEVTSWTVAAPLGRSVTILSRVTEDRPGEVIAWASTAQSDIETRGRVRFREAPGGRGTHVEAVIAYTPPGGAIGRLAAGLFQLAPEVQARRDLKRLKALMETGEIPTNSNRKAA